MSRRDGRGDHDLRQLAIETGLLSRADGSAKFSCGKSATGGDPLSRLYKLDCNPPPTLAGTLQQGIFFPYALPSFPQDRL